MTRGSPLGHCAYSYAFGVLSLGSPTTDVWHSTVPGALCLIIATAVLMHAIRSWAPCRSGAARHVSSFRRKVGSKAQEVKMESGQQARCPTEDGEDEPDR